MEALKPCPCGHASPSTYETDSPELAVRCPGCSFTAFISDWNNRPVEEALRAENAALKSTIAEAQSGKLTLSEVLIFEAGKRAEDQLRAELVAVQAHLAKLEVVRKVALRMMKESVGCMPSKKSVKLLYRALQATGDGEA